MKRELLASGSGCRGLSPHVKGIGADMVSRFMYRRVIHLIALAAAFIALALVLPTLAMASPSAVVRDCANDGSVDGNYSDADKRAALHQIPADLDEYSDCRSVIAGSIGPKATASSGGPNDASGGGAGATGAPGSKAAVDRKARKARAKRRAHKRKVTEIALGDRQVDPRNAGVLNAADTANGMPLAVVLALIALVLMVVGGTLITLGRRNHGLSGALRRVPFPRLRR